MRNGTGRPWWRPAALLVLLAVVAGVAVWKRGVAPAKVPSPAPFPTSPTLPDRQQLLQELTALQRREAAVAETTWAPEMLAQRHGRVFDELWDNLNRGEDDFGVLDALPLREVLLPELQEAGQLTDGIVTFESAGSNRLERTAWAEWLEARRAEGWQIASIEFRHVAFDPPAEGQAAGSRFRFRGHFQRRSPQERAVLTGDLQVRWGIAGVPDAPPELDQVDASGLELKTRPGPPAFREWLNVTNQPPEKSFFTDPLIVRDLDGDGHSEVVLLSANRVFRGEGDGFGAAPLVEGGPGLVFTGILEDFDGDHLADLLVAQFAGLFLFPGRAGGGFASPPRPVWEADVRLRYGQVITCGDVDRDGDLDVWLGQYKGPYTRGQMPTPYFDANDGNPSWLLLNDGSGRFTDATETRGLAEKRHRRNYSASLVDLDDDLDLDLVTVNDFAGIDVFLNDGRGFFHEATDERIDERHGFGMAHTMADFNRDGRLDLLMTGMRCPTALRLDHLGLTRAERPENSAMRRLMTAGCRLYFGREDGRLAQEPVGADLADAGWTWGCTTLDVDNDGFVDAYAANGHETKQSVGDYEPYFWLHDIYLATSLDDPLCDAYFGSQFSRTRGQGMSYGGYEKNRLYLNRGGTGFAEVGWLLGVALDEDSRNVVADDLDGDGRMDLIVTTFEAWPEVKQTLRIFRNEMASTGNWLTFRLRQTSAADNPVGACVTLRHGGRVDKRWIVTGDSHRSQHAPVVHFGLGGETAVDEVEVRYAGGLVRRFESPAINRVHTLSGLGTDLDSR
ncbi:MAG: CRTAC1 family protein [Verrucomicrobiales bacterium]|nr:CRTAC1 family protein [Verrucomicrobiales bacterium]